MAAADAPAFADDDRPRSIVVRVSPADRIFRGVLRGAGIAVLVMTAGILVFLALQSVPAFKAVGLRFFTTSTWFISTNQFGIAAILPLGVLIALIALIIAIPVGLAAALFISEYAPPRLRRTLIAMIDLMAATPSIIVALFGLYFLTPRILGVEAWLAHHLGFIPVFRFTMSNFAGNYVGSTFIAGVVVSFLVIPIIAALSRQVFSQAPQGEREAAYALGSTRWGMIRTVVLPYGRAGMIGASMLGLGRALGETIAVSFILTPVFALSFHVLQAGGNSPTFMIASHILEAGPKEISALMAAGLALFVMTLLVNTVAAIIINRSRSGASASAD
ncbi:MAG TPA: phosphate ABC transporter permease subunit PstC [Streptosporangiaceae bacterium]|jgi:phosphate transport system permease protein